MVDFALSCYMLVFKGLMERQPAPAAPIPSDNQVTVPANQDTARSPCCPDFPLKNVALCVGGIIPMQHKMKHNLKLHNSRECQPLH